VRRKYQRLTRSQHIWWQLGNNKRFSSKETVSYSWIQFSDERFPSHSDQRYRAYQHLNALNLFTVSQIRPSGHVWWILGLIRTCKITIDTLGRLSSRWVTLRYFPSDQKYHPHLWHVCCSVRELDMVLWMGTLDGFHELQSYISQFQVHLLFLSADLSYLTSSIVRVI